jgi:hypothetical protein
MPQQNLDFLSRLPQNMMPQVDFSNIQEQIINYQKILNLDPQMGFF